MRWQEVVGKLVALLDREPSVEGAFLGGSLVTDAWDELSDIDLGVASGDSTEDLDRAHALRYELAAVVGTPVHVLEKAWAHSRMIAVLYARSEFPPIGLEVDLFFSQLQHVSELMPGASFGIVFDRRGRVREALDRIVASRQLGEIRLELQEQMTAFPFDANHAAKALARGDLFNFQFVAERMRGAIFSAAASRHGHVVRGSKRTFRYLSPGEKETILHSYYEFSGDTIQALMRLYLSLLAQVQRQYGIEPEVEHLRATLEQVT